MGKQNRSLEKQKVQILLADLGRKWNLLKRKQKVKILLVDVPEKVELTEAKVESSASNVEAIHGKVEQTSREVGSANLISGFPCKSRTYRKGA